MILGKNMLKEYYQDIDEEQYQPNGIDLKLQSVEMFDSEQDTIGIIDGEKKLPNMTELEPDDNGYYTLKKDTYYLFDLGVWKIPENTAGLFWIRSTLMRMGANLSSSIADSGYDGTLKMAYYNPVTDVKVKKGERVVQMALFDVAGAGTYDGDYQNDEIYNK